MSSSFQKYYTNDDYKKKHLASLRKRYVCECGKEINYGNRKRHVLSTLHVNRMKIVDANAKRFDENRIKVIEDKLNIVDGELIDKSDDDRLIKIEKRLSSLEKKLCIIEKN